MKITIVGDIMAELPIVTAAKKKSGSYDFKPMFREVKPLFAEADYVIGNLESPLAGEEALYSQHYFAFNTPDEMVDAIQDAGIDLLSTVNNHTFDRGREGLERTIRVMDEKKMAHTGTYLPGAERPEAFYFEVDGTRFAVIAYTYGTNYNGSGGKWLAEGELEGTVNLLRPQAETVYLPGVLKPADWVDKLFPKFHTEKRARIKKKLGMVYNYSRADDNLNRETMAPYVEQFQNDIRKAREKADVVLFYPHVGGQFNPKVGAISQYVFEKGIEAGADAVLASHSHLIQKAEWKGEIPCAYSLGNFSMSPDSGIMIPELLPGIGLAMHLYVENKKIEKVTFSMLKAVEKKNELLVSWPVDVLYAKLDSAKEKAKLEEEVRQIYRTVTGKDLQGECVRREYELSR